MPDVRLLLTSGIYLSVIETTHFINTGFGWLCKRCSAEQEEESAGANEGRARFFTEGEAEAKEPRLSTPALARWTDATRQTLVCPRCSIEETISKA
ncbi:MAG TPA: hypothetical protein VF553_12645 [Pyrinomonadaceae bacterium]